MGFPHPSLQKWKCRKTGKLIQKFGRMGDSTVPIPNTIKSYKISQKNYLQNTQHVVLRNCPIYRHGKDCLSKQPPWRAARRARCTCFFSPSSFGGEFFCTFPTKPTKVLGLIDMYNFKCFIL